MKGHQRHSVVDLLGHRLQVEVHAAHLSDTGRGGAVMRRAAEKHPGIEAFSGNASYRGTAVQFVDEKLGWVRHLSQRIGDGFAVLPKRWLVERTFAWFGSFRRLSKAFETLTGTTENLIRIAMLRATLAKCV